MLRDFDSWHRCTWRSINVVPNLSRWIIICSSNTEASTFWWLCLIRPRSQCSWLVSKKKRCQFRWNSVKYCVTCCVLVGLLPASQLAEPPGSDMARNRRWTHRWSDESRDAKRSTEGRKIFGPSLDFQQSWSSSSFGCMGWWSRKSDPIWCVSMFFLNKKRKCRNRFPYCFFSRIFHNRSLPKCRLIWSLGKSASWSSSHEDSAT